MRYHSMLSDSPLRPASSACAALATAELERLNGVGLSATQIDAARRLLASSPAHDRFDPLAQASRVQAYAREAGLGDEPIVAAALHARITALDRWIVTHDPARQSDAAALNQAAAQIPLSELPGGYAFEGDAFQELVLFIEELPW